MRKSSRGFSRSSPAASTWCIGAWSRRACGARGIRQAVASELAERLKTLTSDAEIAEWHRLAEGLAHDLEKAGLTAAAQALAASLHAGGGHWVSGDHLHWVAPVGYLNALSSVTTVLQAKIRDLILKDIVSAHDEATPPEFKELVERYYEVLSSQGGGK